MTTPVSPTPASALDINIVALNPQPIPPGIRINLVGVDPQQWAADATVFVDAVCSVCSSAVAEGEAPALEVAEEFVPFRVGGASVFFAGTQRAAAGDEGAVAVDCFLGIDGLVAHRGIDVFVPQ